MTLYELMRSLNHCAEEPNVTAKLNRVSVTLNILGSPLEFEIQEVTIGDNGHIDISLTEDIVSMAHKKERKVQG